MIIGLAELESDVQENRVLEADQLTLRDTGTPGPCDNCADPALSCQELSLHCIRSPERRHYWRETNSRHTPTKGSLRSTSLQQGKLTRISKIAARSAHGHHADRLCDASLKDDTADPFQTDLCTALKLLESLLYSFAAKCHRQ